MKRTALILGMTLAGLPLLAMAKPASHQPSTVRAAYKNSPTKLKLTGATATESKDIEDIAKQAGAENAKFNAKTGELKIKGSKFNESDFTASLSSKYPSVTVSK